MVTFVRRCLNRITMYAGSDEKSVIAITGLLNTHSDLYSKNI